MQHASLQNEPLKHLRLFGAIACAAMIALPWPNFRVSWRPIHIILVYILIVFFIFSFCKVQNNVRLLGGTDGQFCVFFVCRKKCMNSRWSVEKQFLLANGGGNHDMNNLRYACILHVFFHRQF